MSSDKDIKDFNQPKEYDPNEEMELVKPMAKIKLWYTDPETLENLELGPDDVSL